MRFGRGRQVDHIFLGNYLLKGFINPGDVKLPGSGMGLFRVRIIETSYRESSFSVGRKVCIPDDASCGNDINGVLFPGQRPALWKALEVPGCELIYLHDLPAIQFFGLIPTEQYLYYRSRSTTILKEHAENGFKSEKNLTGAWVSEWNRPVFRC